MASTLLMFRLPAEAGDEISGRRLPAAVANTPASHGT
jgi:hypothetical protein